jgi:hypothetical protein
VRARDWCSSERDLEDAIVRAPIGRVVAPAVVNTGDIVTVGSELFTVVDPSSMRTGGVGTVARACPKLRIGAPVSFAVRGYEQRFEGGSTASRHRRRGDAAAADLRQHSQFSGPSRRLVCLPRDVWSPPRLPGVIVRANAINVSGDSHGGPCRHRQQGRAGHRETGLRDPRTERVQVVSGLSEGDTPVCAGRRRASRRHAVQVSVPSARIPE